MHPVFENLPIISAVFPDTPNKNVDRINYVHYNMQHLANTTRDAVAGLSEQLASTSLMTVQNRMALDMLLAEKGGVCQMSGDQCCTWIANYTAPDGSVTKALHGLKTLSSEMPEHSGTNSHFSGLLDNWFGKCVGLGIHLTGGCNMCSCIMWMLLYPLYPFSLRAGHNHRCREKGP